MTFDIFFSFLQPKVTTKSGNECPSAGFFVTCKNHNGYTNRKKSKLTFCLPCHTKGKQNLFFLKNKLVILRFQIYGVLILCKLRSGNYAAFPSWITFGI